MSTQLYKVELDQVQRDELEQIVRKGHQDVHVFNRAHILLKAATGWNDHKIGEALRVSYRTALRTRQRFCEGGLASALYSKKSSGAPKKYNGDFEAFIVATACGPAPEGHAQWSLRLLASHAVDLGLAENISPETVRAILKKTNYSPSVSRPG